MQAGQRVTTTGSNDYGAPNMANAKRKSRTSRPTRAARANARGGARGNRTRARSDAVSLLKADHRQVEGWFEQFEKTRSGERKRDLAQKICAALKVHTTLEEEIFYPAFLEATEEKEIHHEAEIEHEGAKNLIAEIEASGPEDDYYDAKVKVLSEMIKHHVNEEERRDGMFAKAKQSDMDLDALGEQLAARKAELMAGANSGSPRATSRRISRRERSRPGLHA